MKAIPHGTFSGYNTHKCRCDICKAFIREQRQYWRNNRIALPSKPCACGCGELVHARSKYRPGHSQKKYETPMPEGYQGQEGVIEEFDGLVWKMIHKLKSTLWAVDPTIELQDMRQQAFLSLWSRRHEFEGITDKHERGFRAIVIIQHGLFNLPSYKEHRRRLALGNQTRDPVQLIPIVNLGSGLTSLDVLLTPDPHRRTSESKFGELFKT
jgi:hypothetical protein